MQTDFREERRWKMQVSINLAHACAAYVAASPEMREHLRVKARIPPKVRSATDSMDDVPDLEESTSTHPSEGLDDDHHPIISLNPPPHALFSLEYSDCLFEVDQTPTSDALFAELPLYNASIQITDQNHKSLSANDSLVPISGVVNAKILPKASGIPPKRSRYDYDDSSDDSCPPLKRQRTCYNPSHLPVDVPKRGLPAEAIDVALFSSEHRPVLSRIRNNYLFRLPPENLMPSVDYYLHRQQSQWTREDDHRLKQCVREYPFNWSLIAQVLSEQTMDSQYTSAYERRSPWECFERWTQLEGIPSDMSKIYAKGMLKRIHDADAEIARRSQALVQASQSNNSIPIRRRTSSQPIQVERRHQNRHMCFVDAFRKMARRRENMAHRQQENSKAAALRKAHAENNPQAQSATSTPSEVSRRRLEEDIARKRKDEEFRRQKLVSFDLNFM